MSYDDIQVADKGNEVKHPFTVVQDIADAFAKGLVTTVIGAIAILSVVSVYQQNQESKLERDTSPDTPSGSVEPKPANTSFGVFQPVGAWKGAVRQQLEKAATEQGR